MNYHQFHLFLIIAISNILIISGQLINRCDLVQVLHNYRVDFYLHPDWICIAEHHSGYNVSYYEQEPSGREFLGLFRILKGYWCDTSGGCGIACSELQDDIIENDVKCALTINDKQAFNAWRFYSKFCKNHDLKNYTAGCQVVKNPGEVEVSITSNNKHKKFIKGQDGAAYQYLSCKARGNPVPTIEWHYSKVMYPDAFAKQNGNKSRLVFPTPPSEEATFDCHAKNFFSEDTASFRVKYPEPQGFPYAIVIPVIFFTLVIISGLFIYVFRKKILTYFIKQGLSQQEITEFMKGASGQIKSDVFFHENVAHQPYDTSYELQIGKLKIYHESELGKGQFGLVFRGDLDNTPVAVKTVRDNTDLAYLRALLGELKVMIHIGKHPSIVCLLGAITQELSKGQVYIAVELCPLGDLEKYLRASQPRYVDMYNPKTKNRESSFYANIDSVSTLDIFQWALQVSSAMEYLELRKVIHGDLACRNILLRDKATAKITDFGLSRQLYAYTDYVKKQQAPLPWKWMAIESLRTMTFSSQSDVWAFGVTLWEMFSLGDIPYPGLSWSLEFPSLLQEGMRLQKPDNASASVYILMQDCWNTEPTRRPSFAQLLARLRVILSQLQTKEVVNNEVNVSSSLPES